MREWKRANQRKVRKQKRQKAVGNKKKCILQEEKKAVGEEPEGRLSVRAGKGGGREGDNRNQDRNKDGSSWNRVSTSSERNRGK